MNAQQSPSSRGRLAGKTAVVTGGTTGLGLETARHFIAEGVEVLITGRSQEKLDRALESLGSQAAGLVADSTKIADLQALASQAKERFGKVDILFANAGGGIFAPLAESDEAAYDRQFDVNVKGVFFTVQSFLPLLGTGSSVILTASAVHAKGAPGGSLYFASKAAVRSFARSLAAELAGAGVRVNALSPGIVPTQFFANSNVGEGAYGQFEEMAGKAAPLGRAGRPEEIAKAALFLASDESSYMTGADLTIDGGWSQI
ncbi:MAG: glucose 1-dehydrogenase [Pseudomonadota bacterium]